MMLAHISIDDSCGIDRELKREIAQEISNILNTKGRAKVEILENGFMVSTSYKVSKYLQEQIGMTLEKYGIKSDDSPDLLPDLWLQEGVYAARPQ